MQDAATGGSTAVTSIELTFDDHLEDAVRAEWDALRAAGLSSLAAHTAASNRPHLTLLARRSLAPFDPVAVAGLLPLPVILGAPVLFGRGPRRVLARAVVPSSPLVHLHAVVHAAAERGDDLPHTGVDGWMPHVTLARRVRVEQLPAALDVVGADLRGSATGLRRWDSAEKVVTLLA